MSQTSNFTARHDRPVIPWRTDRPPASEKVIYLTKYGVLNIGNVTRYEWDKGFMVCWQKCPKRPDDWDALLDAAEKRR
jgi:hypothetical protein